MHIKNIMKYLKNQLNFNIILVVIKKIIYNKQEFKFKEVVMEELILKKCKKCGIIARILKENENNEINCCNEKMTTIKPNSVECAVEKHIPQYEIKEDRILVKVNHVMEEKHYIEWITLKTENTEQTVYFKPGDAAEAIFPYVKNSKIYAYCNLHELWVKDVD